VTRVTVRVTPRASRNEIQRWDGDVLRVRVTAPPADGKANDAVLALLAKVLRLPKSSIKLVSGGSSRTKIVELDGVAEPEIRARLAGDR
jgi:uncharacterized protein (TIGR00251 family)